MKKKTYQEKIEEDPSIITVIDSENQSLEFRVGRIFTEHFTTDIGLWIWYQNKYLESKQEGPVLITKKGWERIKKYIDRKFKKIVIQNHRNKERD